MNDILRRILRPISACLTLAFWLCGTMPAQCETLSYSIMVSESLSVLKSPNNMTVAKMAAWAPQHSLMSARTMPYFELRNTSDSGQITQFSMTIGDASKNFDWASLVETSPGVTFSLASPDSVVGNLRSDVLTINFTGFDPGDFVRFRTALRPDNPNASPIVDYRDTFFKLNGTDSSSNSLVSVTHNASGGPYTQTDPLPNFVNSMPTSTSLRFRRHNYGMDNVMPYTNQCSTTIPVPEPGGMVLSCIGALGLIGWKLRRRLHR